MKLSDCTRVDLLGTILECDYSDPSVCSTEWGLVRHGVRGIITSVEYISSTVNVKIEWLIDPDIISDSPNGLRPIKIFTCTKIIEFGDGTIP